MKIGRTELSGLDGYDDDMAPPLPMEYPPIEELSLIDAFVPSGEDLKSMGVAAGTAAAGIIGVSFLLPKIPFVKNWNKFLKIGLTAGIGLLGGNAIGRKNRDAGIGFAAGLIGLSIAQLIADFAKIPIGLGETDDDEVRRELSALSMLPEEASLTQVDTTVEERLGYQVGVETEQRLGATDDWGYQVGVETEQKLGWIGG
jgi:hypothetical protein